MYEICDLDLPEQERVSSCLRGLPHKLTLSGKTSVVHSQILVGGDTNRGPTSHAEPLMLDTTALLESEGEQTWMAFTCDDCQSMTIELCQKSEVDPDG